MRKLTFVACSYQKLKPKNLISVVKNITVSGSGSATLVVLDYLNLLKNRYLSNELINK
jgi:hypothetical protein